MPFSGPRPNRPPPPTGNIQYVHVPVYIPVGNQYGSQGILPTPQGPPLQQFPSPPLMSLDIEGADGKNKQRPPHPKNKQTKGNNKNGQGNQQQGGKGQNTNQQETGQRQNPNQHHGPRGQNPNQQNKQQGPRGQNPNQHHGPRQQNPNQHHGPRGQNSNQQNKQQGPGGQNQNQQHGPRFQNPNQQHGPRFQNPNQHHSFRGQNPNQPNQQHGNEIQNLTQHQRPRGQNLNLQNRPRGHNPNQQCGNEMISSLHRLRHLTLSAENIKKVVNPSFFSHSSNLDISDTSQIKTENQDPTQKSRRRRYRRRDKKQQNESAYNDEDTDTESVSSEISNSIDHINLTSSCYDIVENSENETKGKVYYRGRGRGRGRRGGNRGRGRSYRGRGGNRGTQISEKKSDDECSDDSEDQESIDDTFDEEEADEMHGNDNGLDNETNEFYEDGRDGKRMTSYRSHESLTGSSIGQGHNTGCGRGGRGRGGHGRGGPRRGGRGRGDHRGSIQSSVESIPRWTSNESMNDGSSRKERIHKNSEDSEIGIEIDENKVFTFLVQKFDGKAKYDEFKQKCDLFPPEVSIDKWFRKNKRHFTLFEKDNQIHYLSAFYRDASYCFNYARGSGNKRRCTEPSKCDYFHVCVDFLTNSCNVKNCKFSHSFSDNFNHKQKLKLGLEVFSDKEIASIVLNRLPSICKNSINDKSCFLPHCPNLHICSKYLIGKCFRDPCNVGHSFSTRHNTWILQAFQMDDWPKKREGFLRKILLFPRLQVPGENYGDEDEEMGENVLDDDQTSLVDNFVEVTKTTRPPPEKLKNAAHSRKNRTFPTATASTEFLSSIEPDKEYKIDNFDSERNRKYQNISTNDEESVGDNSTSNRETGAIANREIIENADLIDLMELEPLNPSNISKKDPRETGAIANRETIENAYLIDLMELEPLNLSNIPKKDPREAGAIPKTKSAWKDVSSESLEAKMKKTLLKLQEEDTSKKALCSNFIAGKCPHNKCRDLHNFSPLLPYIWQIKLYGKWVSFGDTENEELESIFCSPQMENNCITKVITHEMCHNFKVNFSYNSSDMSAVLFSIDDRPAPVDDCIPVRRLSTKSYSKFPADKPQGFGTQWRWYWKDDLGQWQPFETDELQYTLEMKYLDGQKTYLFTRLKLQFKYRIDFVKFQQLNLDTCKYRGIARKPNTFVPKSDVINCQYPDGLNIPSAPPRPPGFAVWDCAHDFELVEIESSSDEHKHVIDMMCETISRSKLNIETLYRIQNKKLWRAYDAKKKNMQEDGKKDGSDENEKTLFHGTDSFETCKGICTNNFDFRLSGKNGTLYGEGAYFAKEAKYSNNYTKSGESNQRYMFLAKVLVGSYTKGNSSFKRPPGTGVGSKLYDTCVDNESDPKIFVVFELNQCYPLYLVVYQYRSETTTRPSSIQPVISQTASMRSPSTSQSPSYLPKQSSSTRQVVSPGTNIYSNPYQSTSMSYPSPSVSVSSRQGSSRVTSPVTGISSRSSSTDFDQDDYRKMRYPSSEPGGNIKNVERNSPEKTCIIQ